MKLAAAECGTDFRVFGTRIRPRFDDWVRLEQLDPARTRVMAVKTMCELRGEPYPFLDRVPMWEPREIEEHLQRGRGTGRQCRDAIRRTIARLTLADPMLTAIDLLEAQHRLEEMGEIELERRYLMQTGKLDRSTVFKVR